MLDVSRGFRKVDGMTRISAYERFRERLHSGELKPGQFVTQRELAELAGVSLGSAREAIQKLEHDSLLKVHPQRGIQVADLTIRFIRESFQLRKILELAAIQTYATDKRRESEALAEETRRALAETKKDMSPQSLDNALEVDWRMHDEFISSTNNSLLQETYQINSVRLRLIRSNIKLDSNRVVSALSEHIEILEACAAGDAQLSGERLSSHLDIAMRRAMEGL